jgi:hypothetical protein
MKSHQKSAATYCSSVPYSIAYRLPKNDDSVVGSGFLGSSTTTAGFFG